MLTTVYGAPLHDGPSRAAALLRAQASAHRLPLHPVRAVAAPDLAASVIAADAALRITRTTSLQAGLNHSPAARAVLVAAMVRAAGAASEQLWFPRPTWPAGAVATDVDALVAQYRDWAQLLAPGDGSTLARAASDLAAAGQCTGAAVGPLESFGACLSA
jgi:hypothetical protein